jgi:sulfopropanediol 3-dehydrogenase
MTREYLKKATLTAKIWMHRMCMNSCSEILNDIEEGGDAKAMEYAAKFDKYDGNVILYPEEIEAACALVPEKLKADIQFAHDNVKRFAEAQKAPSQMSSTKWCRVDCGTEGYPVDAAGCYVPGGRYSHIASAIMTVTTAKVAGCKHIYGLLTATSRCWDCACDRLRSAYLRRGQNHGDGRCSGRRCYDVRTVRSAKGEYSCGPR